MPETLFVLLTDMFVVVIAVTVFVAVPLAFPHLDVAVTLAVFVILSSTLLKCRLHYDFVR